MRAPRTLDQLLNDPRVANFSDERTGGMCNDGLWLYLMPGWVVDGCSGTVHEYTVADCCHAMRETAYEPEAYYGAIYGPSELRCLLPGG